MWWRRSGKDMQTSTQLRLPEKSASPGGATRIHWTGGLIQENRSVLLGFGFHAGPLQEAQIAEPVDEAILPSPKRCVVAIRQSSAHFTAVWQWVPGVPAIAVNVHLYVRHTH